MFGYKRRQTFLSFRFPKKYQEDVRRACSLHNHRKCAECFVPVPARSEKLTFSESDSVYILKTVVVVKIR